MAYQPEFPAPTLPLTSSSTPLAVRLQGVVKSFGEGASRTEVLHGIDLSLNCGAMNFIVGPSGCGKTTLISIMASILSVDSGTVELFGTSLVGLNNNQRSRFRRENVGFIFQQFNLIPTITVTENVAVPLLINKVPHGQALKRAEALLEQVGLSDKINAFPRDLSGGQQQRVAIARALVNEPSLVICDEPTSALDGRTGLQIMELLKQVASNPNRCVVTVTHDSRILQLADCLVEMEDGHIIQSSVGRTSL